MGLPEFTGPFEVGAIDLEIPVREPRSEFFEGSLSLRW